MHSPILFAEQGSVLIAPETLESKNQVSIGSTVVFEAKSPESMRKIIDLYWTSGAVSIFSLLAVNEHLISARQLRKGKGRVHTLRSRGPTSTK